MKKLITLILLSLSTLLYGQDPIYDPSFGVDGKIFQDLSTGQIEVIGAIVQRDQKWVVLAKINTTIWVPHTTDHPIRTDNYFITRIDLNGSIDSSFGAYGKYQFDHSTFPQVLTNIATDSSDRIYISGKELTSSVGAWTRKWSHFVLRLDRNGEEDHTFGQNAFYYLAPSFDSDFNIQKLFVNPTNKVLIGGSRLDGNIILTQLNESGQLDTTFGTLGVTQFLFPWYPEAYISDIQIQHDSMLLISSYGWDWGLITRFYPNGTKDLIFGNKKITFPTPSPFIRPAKISKLFVLPDQHFLLGGTFPKPHLWKFKPDGQADQNFGTNGLVHFGDSAVRSEIRGLEVDSTGNIYLLTATEQNTHFSLYKRDSFGLADSSFGVNGIQAFTKNGTQASHPQHLHLIGNKIQTLGSCYPEMCLFQLDTLGNLDSTFHEHGILSFQFPGSGTFIDHMKIDSSGHIWAIGFYAERAPKDRLLYRYKRIPFLIKIDPLGDTLDIDLDVLDIGRQSLEWGDMEIGPDQSIFISGSCSDTSDTQPSRPFIFKLKPNGEPDSTFGSNGISVIKINPTIPVTYTIEKGYHLAIQDDNKPVLTYLSKRGGSKEIGMLRCTQMGQIDTSFNHVGYSPRDFRSVSGWNTSFDLRIGPKGNIYKISTYDGRDIVFEKYSPLGARIFYFHFGNGGNYISGAQLLMRDNGKALIAQSHNFKFNMFQYLDNGIRDSSFGFDGFENVSFPTDQIRLRGAHFFPNQDIMLIGSQTDENLHFSIIMTRLDSNGHRKRAFGQDGKYRLDFGRKRGRLTDTYLDENGTLLVCGTMGSEAFIFRFLQDLVLPIQSELLPSSPERPLIYPNPLTQQASLRLTLSRRQEVNIQLYDLQGRHIQSLHQGIQLAGEQDISMEFRHGLAPGFYLVQVETEEGATFIKVQIL